MPPLKLITLFLATLLLANSPMAGAAEKPNIVFILADDLGYGDLSSYGQKILQTPNLDRLAAEGMRFTRNFTGSTVCAPSRSVLMTGLHTGHTPVRTNWDSEMPSSTPTVASLLKLAGYATGAFGKWGIGNAMADDDPNKKGFDQFYGYVDMFHAHNLFPPFLIRNGRREALRNDLIPGSDMGRPPGTGLAQNPRDYAPELIVEEALKFIGAQAKNPFFLYLALNTPHANNEGTAVGRGMEVPDFGPFAGRDWPKEEKGFARMMRDIDRDVARVVAKLREHGIAGNTLVIFTTDNGPHQEGGHKVDFFDSNGPLRGQKRDLYEGGICAPTIAWWPGRVPAGKVTDHLSGSQDFLPTFCELAGVKAPKVDGISMVPTLLGRAAQQSQHDYLYWEFYEGGGKQAVVTKQWKAVRLKWNERPDGPLEIYNLQSDPGEERDVAADNPEVVKAMQKRLAEAHVPHTGKTRAPDWFGAKQPSGATGAAPALVGTPPTSAVFATDQPSSGFWREHWFVRDMEHGNPPVSGRFRVNDAFAAFQKSYKDRKEVRANGMMQIPSDIDVTTVRAAELYLEIWGGHAGTANKRVTVNGRSTYELPDDGTAAHLCAHVYPSLALRITDVLRGYNVFQFACERGTSFWGHYIVDEACLRLELPTGHAELAKVGLAGFAARVDARIAGETVELSLVGADAATADVASVEFFGCYEGFDENGAGPGRQWHGFTRKRETLGHLGTVTATPFRVTWDTSMRPAQRNVAVRAVVRFKSAPEHVFRTPVREGLEIAARPGLTVAVFGLKELPQRFWSRAGRSKSAVIPLPVELARIERAELHTITWAGGAGEVKEYFKLNGRHFPVAEGSDHRTQYTVFPVEPALLRAGENTVEVLSDTPHHGIEILKPGPALVVRYRSR